jgi:hypothetical protein
MPTWLLAGMLLLQGSAPEAPPDTLLRERLLAHQRHMMLVLGSWAVGSVVIGGYQALRGDRFVRFVGYQNLAWGAIDGAIALYGVRDLVRKRSGPERDWGAEARAFRRLLLLNAGLDVLYITAGAFLLWQGKDARWRGTGLGIVIQGAFLLLLDGIGYVLAPGG